jgi:pimeloyl-ACP methyl ester carboxylesterase
MNTHQLRTHNDQSHASFRLIVICCAFTLSFSILGCSKQIVRLRENPKNPLTETLMLTASGGPKPSFRTQQLLNELDLGKTVQSNPEAVLVDLWEYTQEEPDAEKHYALAEVSYIAAKKRELKNDPNCIDLYYASVKYAYDYLFANNQNISRNPYDPQFRAAVDLYNTSLETCLRQVQEQGNFKPGTRREIQAPGCKIDLKINIPDFMWRENLIHHFEFVSDYQLTGLNHIHETYGLGVPLIAVCHLNKLEKNRGTNEVFFPELVCFPVTAFLRLEEKRTEEGFRVEAHIDLINPLKEQTVFLNNVEIPLQTDITTPLAYNLENFKIKDQALWGLLKPQAAAQVQGLKMLDPYDPNKIPILMVHGLNSSPMTWMEMFNDLRSDPIVRQNYQFWFYQYPTGQPFPLSASQLRDELKKLRDLYDPERKHFTLDQMVVVGHSMGGLISRMMTIDSGNQLWATVSDQDFQLVSDDSAAKEELRKVFFVEPHRSFRRVITIGSPHRGSEFANPITRFFARNVIELPSIEKLLVMNAQNEDGVNLLRDPESLKQLTSIDTLAPDSPVLPIIHDSPKGNWVIFHNIVGITLDDVPLEENTDGVVPYSSAHLDDVNSELIVGANHTSVHQHPRSVREVRRILYQHLKDYDTHPFLPQPTIIPVGSQQQPQNTGTLLNQVQNSQPVNPVYHPPQEFDPFAEDIQQHQPVAPVNLAVPPAPASLNTVSPDHFIPSNNPAALQGNINLKQPDNDRNPFAKLKVKGSPQHAESDPKIRRLPETNAVPLPIDSLTPDDVLPISQLPIEPQKLNKVIPASFETEVEIPYPKSPSGNPVKLPTHDTPLPSVNRYHVYQSSDSLPGEISLSSPKYTPPESMPKVNDTKVSPKTDSPDEYKLPNK